ncbi:MAG: hypothetical protein QNL62_23805 [Gammaproteobacteria bacterium]|nr:hypothetical protein [Gammaproteobacteria bacterium]
MKQAEQLYFMPLHWRHKEKIFKHFKQEHELVKQRKLRLKFIQVKQQGRWALSVLESTLINTKGTPQVQNNPLWFFYYDDRWQVISPVIFKTGPVRAMMDLYREQHELRAWYEQSKYNSIKNKT